MVFAIFSSRYLSVGEVSELNVLSLLSSFGAAVRYRTHHGEHLARIRECLILTDARPAAVNTDRIFQSEIALCDAYSVYCNALVEADLLGGLCQRVVAEFLRDAGEGAVAGFAECLLEIELSVDGVALDDTRRGLVLTGAGKGARIYIGYIFERANRRDDFKSRAGSEHA